MVQFPWNDKEQEFDVIVIWDMSEKHRGLWINHLRSVRARSRAVAVVVVHHEGVSARQGCPSTSHVATPFSIPAKHSAVALFTLLLQKDPFTSHMCCLPFITMVLGCLAIESLKRKTGIKKCLGLNVMTVIRSHSLRTAIRDLPCAGRLEVAFYDPPLVP